MTTTNVGEERGAFGTLHIPGEPFDRAIACPACGEPPRPGEHTHACVTCGDESLCDGACESRTCRACEKEIKNAE